jgi:hypothetical protein
MARTESGRSRTVRRQPVALGHRRRPHCGGRRAAQGDGLRHGCRTARGSRALHGLRPDDLYGMLGSSRVLSVSSTETLAILAGTALGLAVPDGDPARLVTATATLTTLVGAMLVIARVLRLGFVADFTSAPVLTGCPASAS